MRATGSWYDVQTADQVVPSRVRGKFRLDQTDTTNPVVVGDRVTVRLEPDDTGLITEIHPRRNKLSRRAAGRRVGLEHILVANIDQAWCIQAVRKPKLNPGFIDRFLVMAEIHEIPAGLILNKIDLLRPQDEDYIGYWCDLYLDLGYPVLPISAKTGENLDAFAEVLTEQVSVVAGPSGAGKSTLLNTIDPSLNLRTSHVSERTQKGRHTTTAASLHALANGGFVVDTPGVREFGIVDLEPDELDYYFREFRPYLGNCHFPNCTHDHEPGCAVKEAVEAEAITEDRYVSYLNILFTLHLGDADVGR